MTVGHVHGAAMSSRPCGAVVGRPCGVKSACGAVVSN